MTPMTSKQLRRPGHPQRRHRRRPPDRRTDTGTRTATASTRTDARTIRSRSRRMRLGPTRTRRRGENLQLMIGDRRLVNSLAIYDDDLAAAFDACSSAASLNEIADELEARIDALCGSTSSDFCRSLPTPGKRAESAANSSTPRTSRRRELPRRPVAARSHARIHREAGTGRRGSGRIGVLAGRSISQGEHREGPGAVVSLLGEAQRAPAQFFASRYETARRTASAESNAKQSNRKFSTHRRFADCDLPQPFHDLLERLRPGRTRLERQRRERLVDDVQLRRGSRRDPARCR